METTAAWRQVIMEGTQRSLQFLLPVRILKLYSHPVNDKSVMNKIWRANLISLIGMLEFRETHNVHNLSHT